MYLLCKKIQLDKTLNVELEFGIDGYQTAELVHYANYFIIKNATTKQNAILNDPRSKKFS